LLVRLAVLAFVAGSGFVGCIDEESSIVGGPEDGSYGTNFEDFEDGDLSSWKTWTYPESPSDSAGPGFNLSTEGGPYRAGGELGLKVQRDDHEGWAILEAPVWEHEPEVRFVCSVRPFISGDSTQTIAIHLSDESAKENHRVRPNAGIAFHGDGRMHTRGWQDTFLGTFRAKEWLHVTIWVDTALRIYKIRVNGPGVDHVIESRATQLGWRAETVRYVSIIAGTSGRCTFALDDILTREFEYEVTGEATIDDYAYLAGKFFLLLDPDGPPLFDLHAGSVEVWVDDRRVDNDIADNAIGAYATLSGDPGLPESGSSRATGSFHRLAPAEDYVVQQDVYLGYPIIILNDRNQMDGRMTEALAVRYHTIDGETIVGGVVAADPRDPADQDSLILKLIRPASEMGGTNPFDLTEGILAPTRFLELRNVYRLFDTYTGDLSVKLIYKRFFDGAYQPDRIGPHTFLSITGLDLFTYLGNGEETPGPDGQIDQGRVSYISGLVIFSELHPFAPTEEDITRRFFWERPDTLTGSLTAPGIYIRSNWNGGEDPENVSRYRFEITRRVPINGGPADLEAGPPRAHFTDP
jgi:hypothetical protein